MKKISFGSLLKLASMFYLMLQSNFALARKEEGSQEYNIEYTEFQFDSMENTNNAYKLAVTNDFYPKYGGCWLGKSLQSQLYDDVVEVGQQFQKGLWCNTTNATLSTTGWLILLGEVDIVKNYTHVGYALEFFIANHSCSSNISSEQRCIESVLFKVIDPYKARETRCHINKFTGMAGGILGMALSISISIILCKSKHKKGGCLSGSPLGQVFLQDLSEEFAELKRRRNQPTKMENPTNYHSLP